MTRGDLGREAVYAAEIAAFDGTSHETVTDFDALVAVGTAVTSASWWPHGPVAVERARSDAASSSARRRTSGATVIRLAAPQMTVATVLHELAHVLAGIDAGHGARFRRAHVDVVGYVLGDEAVGWLLDAYRAFGLEPGERAWPTPGLRPEAGGPIAL